MRGRGLEEDDHGQHELNTTPTSMGTLVRLTTSRGVFWMEPETIITTADTGETARSRLPARPMGTETARTLMPAAAARGTIRGTMAKNRAVPLPLSSTMRAVRATRIRGSTKPMPLPCTPVMASCRAEMMPMEFRPLTKVVEATSRATMGMALPMPLKKASVDSRVARALRERISSQITAMTREKSTATSTLRLMVTLATDWRMNTTISSRMGSRGRMP